MRLWDCCSLRKLPVIENLSRALETRSLIGTEVGLRMEREGLTMEEAFESLKTESQKSNIKLRDVAQQSIERFEIGLHESREKEEAGRYPSQAQMDPSPGGE
jgi:hypothetical protein